MTTPDWLTDAIFYQIFPERYANARHDLDPEDTQPWDSPPTRENFLGGDIEGIIQNLDHITELGANTLYMTPIFKAESNHRYDTTDYFAIDPSLGDLNDFHRLVEAAHDRGIRIVLDAVLNHCGTGHWAFKDAVANKEDSDYVNWFFIEDFPVTQSPRPNYRTCSGYAGMPKWNTYNPAVRRHHFDVAKYWIEQGIDGWRLDVPFFIPMPFWRRFREVVKGIDNDLYIVAEEWLDPVKWLHGDTVDGTMNYVLRDLILRFTADLDINAYFFADKVNRFQARLPEGHRRAMLNLLGSHDTERVLTRHDGHRDQTLLAFTLLFALEGIPMVYYGDEVGVAGDNDPGCRAAMPWDRASWDQVILDHISSLVSVRKNTQPLRTGTQKVVAVDSDTVVVLRTLPDSQVAVFAHRGQGVTVDLGKIPEIATTPHWNVLLGGSKPGQSTSNPNALKLGAKSVSILSTPTSKGAS